MTNHYQEIYEYWYNRPGSEFLRKTPYCLSLGIKGNKSPLPPGSSVSLNEILVTASYNDAFHRLLRLREGDVGVTKGAVLTGQPGVGASF